MEVDIRLSLAGRETRHALTIIMPQNIGVKKRRKNREDEEARTGCGIGRGSTRVGPSSAMYMRSTTRLMCRTDLMSSTRKPERRTTKRVKHTGTFKKCGREYFVSSFVEKCVKRQQAGFDFRIPRTKECRGGLTVSLA